MGCQIRLKTKVNVLLISIQVNSSASSSSTSSTIVEYYYQLPGPVEYYGTTKSVLLMIDTFFGMVFLVVEAKYIYTWTSSQGGRCVDTSLMNRITHVSVCIALFAGLTVFWAAEELCRWMEDVCSGILHGGLPGVSEMYHNHGPDGRWIFQSDLS